MKSKDGVVYATNEVEQLQAVTVKPLSDMILIVSFNTGEERIFDATILLDMPVFQPLREDDVFKACRIVNGVITWCDGDIDIATESLYHSSFKYDKLDIS